MNKRTQTMLIAGLILFCALVLVVVAVNDPARRAPSGIGDGPRRVLTPTPAPAMLINAPLVTQPGLDVQADWNRAVVVCWGKEGEPVTVTAHAEANDMRYLRVRAAGCTGWTPDFTVQNYRP